MEQEPACLALKEKSGLSARSPLSNIKHPTSHHHTMPRRVTGSTTGTTQKTGAAVIAPTARAVARTTATAPTPRHPAARSATVASPPPTLPLPPRPQAASMISAAATLSWSSHGSNPLRLPPPTPGPLVDRTDVLPTKFDTVSRGEHTPTPVPVASAHPAQSAPSAPRASPMAWIDPSLLCSVMSQQQTPTVAATTATAATATATTANAATTQSAPTRPASKRPAKATTHTQKRR